MKKLCYFVVTLLIVLLLCSCSFDESVNNFRGGELLDNERMSEIKDSLMTEESGKEKETEEAHTESVTKEDDNGQPEDGTEENISNGSEDTELDISTEQYLENGQETSATDENESKVYWTKSGSVWHVSDKCYHIKNSSNLESGSIEDAMQAGKDKPCSNCGKK